MKIGEKYGRLTILQSYEYSSSVKVQCDCGKIFQTYAEYLTSGCTSSCGCKRTNFQYNHSGISPSLYFNHILKDAKRRKHKFNISMEDALGILNKQGSVKSCLIKI